MPVWNLLQDEDGARSSFFLNDSAAAQASPRNDEDTHQVQGSVRYA